jgi:DHA3 family macrolide efflux protein-like MFS transporter
MSATLHPRDPLPPLFNSNFLLLWQSQTISQLGNQAFVVLMLFWTKERTSSAGLVGLLMMLTSLPSLLIGPIAGAIADRLSRRSIILGADLARGVDLLVLAFLMARLDGTPRLLVPVFFAVTLINAVIAAVFMPAVNAIVPDLVPPQRVTAANSLNALSTRAATSLGLAAGGTLYRLLGAPGLCFIDALSFLLAFGAQLFISYPQPGAAARRGIREALWGYLVETREGFRYVRGRPGMWRYLLTAAALNFFFMPLLVLLPFYVADHLGARVDAYGLVAAAFAIGGMIGSGIAAWVRLHGRGRALLTVSSMLGTSLLFALLALLHTVAAAIACFLCIGVLSAIVNVVVITLFQQDTPASMRGRVMGLLFAVSGAAAPAGMAVGGVLSDLAGRNIPVLYLTCGAATLVITLWASSHPDFRRFLGAEVERIAT